MAPQADAATARRQVRTEPRPVGGAPRRPPLRLFEPAPRRRPSATRLRRSTMWLSGLLVVGSLLAVVVGDTMLAQGQVHLSVLQHEVVSAQTVQKASQVSVAEKSAPPVVVSQAEAQGLVAPSQVVYLPQVPLDAPLPVPQTAAVPSTASHRTTGTAASTPANAPTSTAAASPASR